MKIKAPPVGINVVTKSRTGVDVLSMVRVFIFIFVTIFLALSYGLDLTPESRLRKLSFQIRGLPPSAKDYHDLQQAKADENNTKLNDLFKTKFDSYFKSPWAAAKLSEKIYENWRIENPTDYLAINKVTDQKNDLVLSEPILSMTERSVIKHLQKAISKGQSWDQIIISSSFRRTLDVTLTLQNFQSTYLNYGFKTRMALFKSDYLQKGFKFDTDEEVQQALDEFDKVAATTTVTAPNTNSSYSPTPYLKNSKIDPKFTKLVIQGALDSNAAKQEELFNYLMQLKKNLTVYRDEILGQPQGSSTQLPELIFNLTEMTDRYKKTIYSKAAAFFRIYLCDDMSPVILPGKNSKSQEVFKLIHLATQNESDVQISTPLTTQSLPPPPPPLTTSNSHVQPACSGCHNKLDPMELVFNKKLKAKSTTNNSPIPFEFVYEDYTGKDIKLTISNIEQLPERLQQEPQYIRCQSEKFWNWYIGTDVPISPKQRDDLERVYKSNQSQPVEIIRYLTSLKSFYSDSFLTEPKQFNNVRPILQKCHSCHKSDQIIPSLLVIPFNLDKSSMAEKMSDHIEILESVIKQTNLLNDQRGIKMPPQSAGWSLSPGEKITLIKWINDGAKDDYGNDSITTAQKNKLLAAATNQIMDSITRVGKSQPSLSLTWQRIINYNDILRTFPFKLGTSSVCNQDFISKKNSLGHPDIYTGVPISDKPDNAYREAYRKCVVQSLFEIEQSLKSALANGAAAVDSLAKYYNPLGLSDLHADIVKSATSENPMNLIGIKKWTDLTSEQKIKIAQNQIHFILGPNLNHIETVLDLDKKVVAAVDKIMITNQLNSAIKGSLYSLYYILNSDSFFIY